MIKKNNESSTNQPVSSAELTALWRSLYPSISHDDLSKHLVSDEAKRQSDSFIEMHQYPLVARKISARAGYIFNEAKRLINAYDCDSVVSFACGYSMMGFLLSQAVDKEVRVIDTDLPEMLLDRQQRLSCLPLDAGQQAQLSKVKHLVFDIEKAASENISLPHFFKDCKRPVVILEGITYFLKPQTRDWLISALMKWDNACLILEYWPENALEISAKIKNSFSIDLRKNFKETLKSFMLDEYIKTLGEHYSATDIGVGEAEAILSKAVSETPQLIDQNEYYPIRIFTGVPLDFVEK